MGKTLIIYKISIDEMEHLDSVSQKIKQITVGEVKDVKRTPIGFGIETIKVAILIPEKQDQILDQVTDALQKIPHVEEVEVENMTLL